MKQKKCPKCGEVSLSIAESCTCGYDYSWGLTEEDFDSIKNPKCDLCQTELGVSSYYEKVTTYPGGISNSGILSYCNSCRTQEKVHYFFGILLSIILALILISLYFIGLKNEALLKKILIAVLVGIYLLNLLRHIRYDNYLVNRISQNNIHDKNKHIVSHVSTSLIAVLFTPLDLLFSLWNSFKIIK